jgi:DNA-binding response OmpR family regulator
VLLVTGEEARREKLHGLMAGADDFLTQPIDTSE